MAQPRRPRQSCVRVSPVFGLPASPAAETNEVVPTIMGQPLFCMADRRGDIITE